MESDKKIIIDTNFLLIPANFKVDIFSELERICFFKYKLYIVDRTLKELQNIIKLQKGADKDAAKLALLLIKSKGLKIISTEEQKSVDDLIVELSDENTIVATQDIGLKRRLKAKGIKIITLKSKKKLIFS